MGQPILSIKVKTSHSAHQHHMVVRDGAGSKWPPVYT